MEGEFLFIWLIAKLILKVAATRISRSFTLTTTDGSGSPHARYPTDMDSTPVDRALQPGIYKILNDESPRSSIDLSGHDMKSVIAYGDHNGENQKWEIERLGPGYSIRCLLNGAYITLDSGIFEGCTMIGTQYPVSWVIEPDDFEAGIYRIRWPDTPFVFDLPGGTGHTIQLSNRYPFQPTRLWKFILIKANTSPRTPRLPPNPVEFVNAAPKELEPCPVITTADTVIDAEGLNLGGNGEMSITTTTTTVTTSVTTVKKIVA